MKDRFGIEREEREFYTTSGRKVKGYSCQEPDYWWVPSEGMSLCYEVHIFDTELQASRKGREILVNTINDANKTLTKIYGRIKELEANEGKR